MARPPNPGPLLPLLLLLLLLLAPLPLGAGDYEMDVSPYEDTVTRKPWKMNLSKLNMLKPDSDLCLKFAMLCTLNDKCDRLRKAYGEACSGSRCQRDTCLRQLRAFFEKASEAHAQGLLLCPCAPTDQGCGQRRRNTIAPSCALPSGAPNCLELQSLCVADPLCRSRLVDFQTHCHPLDILGTCATEQSRCLRAYMGLIGTAMTPNFVSNVNISVALSCTCRGSGNLQEECEQLEESFSHNSCLSECVAPAASPGWISWTQGEEKVEAIAAKMRFHSQLFSQDWEDSTFSVMERKNKNPALTPQPWVPSLFLCTLTLILLLSLW
ncbi:GDNF family receptor alpha-3 isoform X4 [Hyaena hyaena]|uniref:GDNF family receptor alpha-3 isoform X4 n=1 Tax=Hyaena hyaena TaxID=95912 RepID=UPI001924DF95|nr:GDNF family receptor alpha-3 isoform X4 [Hyaena hyaena]